MASKPQSLRVVPCSLRKANDFVQVYHRHNLRTSRDGGKFAIAAAVGVDVIGVGIVGNPLSATLMDGFTVEVLRVCTKPDAPKNSNSLIYGACRSVWFAMGGNRIITYTLVSESGSSLRGAGWTLAAESRGRKSVNWGKSIDHLKRANQPIYSEDKYRWEATRPNVETSPLLWPEIVTRLHEGGLFSGDSVTAI